MNNIYKHSVIIYHACFSLPESSMIFFNSSTARDKKMTKKFKLKFAKYQKKKRASPISIFLPSQLVVGLLGKLYRI